MGTSWTLLFNRFVAYSRHLHLLHIWPPEPVWIPAIEVHQLSTYNIRNPMESTPWFWVAVDSPVPVSCTLSGNLISCNSTVLCNPKKQTNWMIKHASIHVQLFHLSRRFASMRHFGHLNLFLHLFYSLSCCYISMECFLVFLFTGRSWMCHSAKAGRNLS